MRHAAQTVEQAPVNSALLNVVTPMGLSFEKNRLSIGENIGKAYGIIRYPQKVDVEWLSKLTNIPSTLVSIGFKRNAHQCHIKKCGTAARACGRSKGSPVKTAGRKGRRGRGEDYHAD